MKKKSITFKLFIITTTFFIVFLMIVAVTQSLFFEKFYIHRKINRLEKSLEEFAQKYDRENWDQVTITKNINDFVNKNNAQMAILDEKAAAKYLPLFNLIIETQDKNQVLVPLNNMLLVEAIQELNLSVGSAVVVEGVYSNSEYNTLYPFSIESKGNKWEALSQSRERTKEDRVFRIITSSKREDLSQAAEPTEDESATTITVVGKTETPLEPHFTEILKEIPNNFIIASARDSQEIVKVNMREIQGKIAELNVPAQKDFMMPYRESMLWTAIDHWFWISKGKDFDIQNEKMIRYQYKSPVNGIDNMVMIKPIFHNGVLKEMVFVMSSLQPVGEAIGVMKDYYIYGFLAAIFIILLLAYIYSRLIADPLIKINNVALRMAELDFSVECDVKSDDEIGNLANSINKLASSLHKNMKNLQDTNEKLRVEIERERTLEKMRKEFVSSASHELKTPLGIMRGFTEGLKDEIAVEKKDYYLDVILEEIEKMDALVLDMLDLSKLESKAYLLVEENFYITPLIQVVENRFIQQIKEKNIEVCHVYDSENSMVRGDKKRIEQVITNIISNAIRHVKAGGFIHIGIKKDGEKIYITIENEGDSIQGDKLNYIWDRFYRVEESRDRKSGGTGLGLAIVKNILELHNSRYGVKNTEKGVMFYFSLEMDGENYRDNR